MFVVSRGCHANRAVVPAGGSGMLVEACLGVMIRKRIASSLERLRQVGVRMLLLRSV